MERSELGTTGGRVRRWREGVSEPMARYKIFAAISRERARQELLYPGETVASDSMSEDEKFNQLVEEVGEVARARRHRRFPQQGRDQNLDEELVQVAAVAVAWLEYQHRHQAEPAPKEGDRE